MPGKYSSIVLIEMDCKDFLNLTPFPSPYKIDSCPRERDAPTTNALPLKTYVVE